MDTQEWASLNNIPKKYIQEDVDLAQEAAVRANEELEDTEKDFPLTRRELSESAALLHKYEQQILSEKDVLTKEYEVLNAAGLEVMARYIARKIAREAARGSPGEAVVLAVLDIDGLKLINDTLSHKAGNEAIKAVASGVREGVRKTDMIGRYGGDEFVVIMPGFKSTDEASKAIYEGRIDKDGNEVCGIAELISENIEKNRNALKKVYGNKWPQDTPAKRPGMASLGWHIMTTDEYLSCFENYTNAPAEGKTTFVDALTHVADKRMYEMKSNGKVLSQKMPPA